MLVGGNSGPAGWDGGGGGGGYRGGLAGGLTARSGGKGGITLRRRMLIPLYMFNTSHLDALF